MATNATAIINSTNVNPRNRGVAAVLAMDVRLSAVHMPNAPVDWRTLLHSSSWRTRWEGQVYRSGTQKLLDVGTATCSVQTTRTLHGAVDSRRWVNRIGVPVSVYLPW